MFLDTEKYKKRNHIIKTNIAKIIENRNFDIQKFEKRNIENSNKYVFIYQHKKQKDKYILVYEDTSSKLGITLVRLILDMMSENIRDAVFVIKEKLTPFAKQAVDYVVVQKNYSIQMFHENEVYLRVFEHKYIPEHHVIDEEEKEKVMKRYSTNLELYPKIMKTDPLVKYYGLKCGDMIKFIRRHRYQSRVMYRVVAT